MIQVIDITNNFLSKFLTFVGGHRGGMTECYHGPCDIYNHKEKHKNNIQWNFLVRTTQTLIGNYSE